MGSGNVPVRIKLMYGIGQAAESIMGFGFGTLLLLYYNQVLGLSAGRPAGGAQPTPESLFLSRDLPEKFDLNTLTLDVRFAGQSGRPRILLAMIFSITSEVPPSIVFAFVRSQPRVAPSSPGVN